MRKLKIHIVEDEIIIAYDLQDMLEDLGYVVNDISMSVEEVSNKLEKDDSDLFIVDINLRGSRSGFELGDILSNQEKSIIYMSSLKDRKSIESAKKNQLLEKPFSKNEIYSAIKALLER